MNFETAKIITFHTEATNYISTCTEILLKSSVETPLNKLVKKLLSCLQLQLCSHISNCEHDIAMEVQGCMFPKKHITSMMLVGLLQPFYIL